MTLTAAHLITMGIIACLSFTLGVWVANDVNEYNNTPNDETT